MTKEEMKQTLKTARDLVDVFDPPPSATVKQTLEAARDVIEAGWTQHVGARDENENEVTPFDENAVCWCAESAISVATRNFDHSSEYLNDPNIFFQSKKMLANQILWELRKVHGVEITRTRWWDEICTWDGMAINYWNDSASRTKEEVLEMFDRTIKTIELYDHVLEAERFD